MPLVVETVVELREAVSRLAREFTESGAHTSEAQGRVPAATALPIVALVPTLGALHAGHLSLIRQARELGQIVVVSIFVNPLQFGPNEDLDKYPRTLSVDLDALDGLADLVFAPSVQEMYPDDVTQIQISAGHVSQLFEGAARPGHFDGVLTVVAKLFNIVRPNIAVFGQKDAQQAFLVGRMVQDLNMPVSIAVVDTVRETDGLALSSRNRFLDPQQRQAATSLSAGLRAGAEVADRGAQAVLDAATSVIRADPAVRLDYLVVVDPETFESIGERTRSTPHHGPALMLVAATLGTTRLIDNERIVLP